MGAPRSGFTCHKYPFKSCATAGPFTNKHRLQLKCHFAHRSQAAKKFPADMSEGKEEELLFGLIL